MVSVPFLRKTSFPTVTYMDHSHVYTFSTQYAGTHAEVSLFKAYTIVVLSVAPQKFAVGDLVQGYNNE